MNIVYKQVQNYVYEKHENNFLLLILHQKRYNDI